jgi:hypothetical protein
MTTSFSQRKPSFVCARWSKSSYSTPLRHVRHILPLADKTSFRFHSMSVCLSGAQPMRKLELSLLSAASVTAVSVTVSDTRCIYPIRQDIQHQGEVAMSLIVGCLLLCTPIISLLQASTLPLLNAVCTCPGCS